MARPKPSSPFPTLLQRFFVEHLRQHRAVSPCTIAAYRDTFRLLLAFALAGRSVSPHCIRHSTAMHLLQSGVDITVIALWLGHESPVTTHMYIEADLSMKERALGKLQPTVANLARYRASDQLMQFLQSL